MSDKISIWRRESVPPLAELLLAVGSCWQKEISSPLRVWQLVNNAYSNERSNNQESMCNMNWIQNLVNLCLF